MRDFLRLLARRTGLLIPGLVAGSVLVLTSLTFFRVALLPEFGTELGMSAVELGWVTTLFALGRLSADLPAGHLADRFPAPRLMAMSAAIAAVGSGLLGGSSVLSTVYVAAFLLGMSSSVTNATGMTYFSWAGGAEARGTAMSMYSAALLGGQAIGPAIGGLVGAAWGWRGAFGLASGIAALYAVAVFSVGGNEGVPSETAQEVEPTRSRDGLGRAQSLVLQAIPFSVFFTLGSVPQTLVPLIGAEELGLRTDLIGLALGLGGVSRFVGTIVGGRISDRVSRKAVLVPGLLLQAVGVGLLAPWAAVGSWLTAIVLMSVASVAVSVAATVLGDLSPPGRTGANLGRFRFTGDVGFIIGPVLVTVFYERLGRAPAALFVALLLAAVGWAAAVVLPETHPRRVTLRDEG